MERNRQNDLFDPTHHDIRTDDPDWRARLAATTDRRIVARFGDRAKGAMRDAADERLAVLRGWQG